MSNILFKSIFFTRHKIRASLCNLNERQLLYVRFLSKTSKDSSFTVSYLINSVGLSPESALKASKYVKFNKPNKPDSVIECLKSQGFTNTQISDVVRRQPILLSLDPQRSILPKIEFFMSKGVSQSDVTKLFTQYPAIMKSRLEEQIVPAFSFLKDIFGSDKVVLKAVDRYAGVLTCNIEGSLVPNIMVLQAYGVPVSNIHYLMRIRPRVLVSGAVVFKEAVKEVEAMGFDPSKMTFLEAVAVKRQLNKKTWKQKVELYKKWGWSEESIIQSFRCRPWCMAASESKIIAVMGFLVDKMGWEASVIVKYPQIVNLSLEKRIIPRAAVIKVLMSKGLIKNKNTLSAFFSPVESMFVDKYIKPFVTEVPEVLKIYKGNLGVLKT